MSISITSFLESMHKIKRLTCIALKQGHRCFNLVSRRRCVSRGYILQIIQLFEAAYTLVKSSSYTDPHNEHPVKALFSGG